MFFLRPRFVVANDLDLQSTLIRDVLPHRGPIGGNHAADMPFLVPELFRIMFDWTENADLVVPVRGKVFEPLLALYNRRCLPAIAKVLESSERSVTAFFEKLRLEAIGEEQWRIVEAEERSFLNVNTQEDWAELITRFN